MTYELLFHHHNDKSLTNFIIKGMIENRLFYRTLKQLKFTENIYHNLLLKWLGNCLQLAFIKVLFFSLVSLKIV